MPIKRAAIYARYSADHQNHRSIEDQIRVCQDYISKQGWTVGEIYTDAAISGATTQRPGYERLRRDEEGGSYDILVAEHLDRLSRDQEETASLYKRLSFRGIEIWTASDGRITELHVGVQGTLNALYLKNLADKTRRGLKGLVSRGRHAGGRSYGYRSVPRVDENQKLSVGYLEIVPEEAEVVRRIFQAYADGRSPKAIAASLNEAGIPAPRGGFWRQSSINGNRARGTGILNNELYIGRQIWNRLTYLRNPKTGRRVSRPNPPERWLKGEIPDLRIVPQELWDAVKARQAKLDARVQRQQTSVGGKTRRAGIGATRRTLNLLTDRLFCGVCGGKMTAAGGHYVRCSTAAESGGSVCRHSRNYRREGIEARVLAALKDDLMRPEAIKYFLETYNAEISKINGEHQRERLSLTREQDRIQRDIDNLLSAIADGLTNASVKTKLDGLEARQAEIEQALEAPAPAAISLNPNAADLYRQRVVDLAAALADPDSGAEARDAARGLIDRIELAPRPGAAKGEFDLVVDGVLSALLQMAGMEKRAAESCDSATRSSGQLVAGAGFEPATFRL